MDKGIRKGKLNIPLGKVLGIKVDIHISFFLILILFGVFLSLRTFEIFGFKIGYGDLDIPLHTRWIMGMLASVLIFSSLFLHELAHSLISNKEGFKVQGITFFMLGGMSKAESFPEEPRIELRIAGVGPIVSLFIGSVFLLISALLEMSFDIGGDIYLVILVLITSIGFYNMIIGLFNLIPAFPLDGGRILRSILGNFMDHYQATMRAARTGKTLAVIMGIFGLFTLNLLLILIAVFVYMGAKNEKDVTEAMHALHDLPVKRIMGPSPGSVPPSLSISDLRKKMMRERKRVYIVRSKRKILGVVSMEDLRDKAKSANGSERVSGIMNTKFTKAGPDDEASSVWKRMIGNGDTRVMVIEDGEVIGQVTLADFRSAIDIKRLSLFD